MKSYTTVKRERAEELEKASNGTLSFRYIGCDFSAMTIRLPGMPELTVEKYDYSVRIVEPAMKQVFVVAWTVEDCGEKINRTKEFDDEDAARDFVRYNLQDRAFTITPGEVPA